MSLADLPPLREVLAEHDLLANKSFGQHFLLDLNITRKIARLSEVGEGDVVIEVGPGPGGLTRALLETGARVVAVEMDRRFIPLLEELGAAADGRLTLIQGDALKVDMAAIAGGLAHMVSNLPYNVGTPLLINWLTGPFRPLSMTLMFQKEVADRIAADVNDDAYGRLAVVSQTVCSAKVVMDLPARAFTPPPKVASAVVRLVPLDPASDKAAGRGPAEAHRGGVRPAAQDAAGQPQGLGGEALCEKAGIDPHARAETIDVAGFQALARAMMG
jgi:16S rRNA (adenine1518-N6/adenine1519-N6)-dimethyltransferase